MDIDSVVCAIVLEGVVWVLIVLIVLLVVWVLYIVWVFVVYIPGMGLFVLLGRKG